MDIKIGDSVEFKAGSEWFGGGVVTGVRVEGRQEYVRVRFSGLEHWLYRENVRTA